MSLTPSGRPTLVVIFALSGLLAVALQEKREARLDAVVFRAR